MSSWLAVFCLLLLPTGAFGFDIGLFAGRSLSHEMITERAILNSTVHVCRDLALAEGEDFTFPPQPFTAESVAAACQASKSSKSFRQAIALINERNRQIDVRNFRSASHHFHDEKFSEGRKIITDGLSAVKASNKRENFEAARERLGQILHTLQDFYSHSNWVEMKNAFPYSNLIRSDTIIDNIADKITATCRDCNGDDCTDNILGHILQQQILTSGYFGFKPNGRLPPPATLQELEVEVIGNRQCNSLYGAISITNNMICAGVLAGGKGTCQGDSGGPLVSKQGSVWVQSGVVSFGVGCARPNLPGVYSRVSRYQSWINSHISSDKPGFVQFTSRGSDADIRSISRGRPAPAVTNTNTAGQTAGPDVGIRVSSSSASSAELCGIAPLNTRIVGGEDASPGNWPWQVNLLSLEGTLCGGSLINREWVMSAAHCFERKSSGWQVFLGRQNFLGSNPNEVFRTASEIIVHPSYDSETINNDIALLRLSSPVNFTDYIRPVCLAARDSVFNQGTKSWVTGWGLIMERGKCSHGGKLDKSSTINPKGGINKDSLDSSHGHLHIEAANMAIAATSQLLDDVRGAAGDRPFLQMMGISKGSSKALCFVIDTTGSMSDDIAAVRTATSSIINDQVGTEDEPSVYILVPFNDPDFGPLMRTTDPNVFKNAINSLTARGGGDFPEMSLSGLRLALTGAPPNSEIFVFTDAPAKDAFLRGTVIALIERTKTVVNFMITNVLGLRRRRESDNSQQQEQQQSSRMLSSDAKVYSDLARASGGQAIEVSKSDLPVAISIVTESLSSSLVTLLQSTRSGGKADNFTFTVDESVRNLTIYITGSSVTFTLISPSGVHQQSTNTTGSLITASQSVGNFLTLQLQPQVGLWEIKMTSTNSYTLKVVGDSPIDFLFDFLEVSQGPLGGFDVVENRPRAGVNGSLIVTVTGADTAMVTEVTLVESSGSGEVNGSVQAQGGGDFLVHFDRIPTEEFVVLVKGQNTVSSSRMSSQTFQRQSTTTIKASTLTVTVEDSTSVLEPGKALLLPFSVMTGGAGGTFVIRATNDQGFTSTFPSSLVLTTGGSANGTVNLTAPPDTPSGTDVTVTIEAEAPGGAETNYVVLRLTVLTPVTDVTRPVCQLLSLQSNCSEDCSSSMWELSVQVSDGAEGTGIDRISLKQGNGTMNTNLTAGNENATLSYNASCCSPDVELLVVDQVGNVETCFFSVRTTSSTTNPTTNSPTNSTTISTTIPTTTSTTSPQTPTVVTVESLSTKIVQSSLLCVCITILGHILLYETGIN